MKSPNNFLNQTKESSKRDIPSDTKGKPASKKTFIANKINYQEDYIDYKYSDNCFLREINASGKESLSISSSMSNKTEPVTFRPYDNPIAQKINYKIIGDLKKNIIPNPSSKSINYVIGSRTPDKTKRIPKNINNKEINIQKEKNNENKKQNKGIKGTTINKKKFSKEKKNNISRISSNNKISNNNINNTSSSKVSNNMKNVIRDVIFRSIQKKKQNADNTKQKSDNINKVSNNKNETMNNNISLRGNDFGNNTIISSGDYGSLFSAIKQTTDNVNTLTQTISGLSSTINAHIKSQEERNKKIDNFIDSQVEMNSYLKSNHEAMKKLLETKGIIIENEKESSDKKKVVPVSSKKK